MTFSSHTHGVELLPQRMLVMAQSSISLGCSRLADNRLHLAGDDEVAESKEWLQQIVYKDQQMLLGVRCPYLSFPLPLSLSIVASICHIKNMEVQEHVYS